MINIHFLIEINKYRKINGKKTVILDDKLQNFSQNRAKYLFENGILEHGKGEDNLANRLNKQKFDRNYCGENLGAGQMSIESIIKARIKSDNHNELLLNDNLENIGIGIIRQEKRQKLYSTRVLTTIGKFN